MQRVLVELRQMTRKKFPRLLPTHVLTSESVRSSDGAAVQKKFSDPHALIMEENTDYAAISLMNDAAIWHWLPKFIQYLKESAEADSYHFEVMLFNLSNAKLSHRLRKAARESELEMVCNFLYWLKSHTGFLSKSSLRNRDFAIAVNIWCRNEGTE